MTTEIQVSLQKQAISVVPPSNREMGFYSAYFLVPKNTGYFRPVLDLRCLNICIACKSFRIQTIKQLLRLDQLGDWFTTIDLGDAYFHVRGQSLIRCAAESVSAVCSFYKYTIASPTVNILPSVKSSN